MNKVPRKHKKAKKSKKIKKVESFKKKDKLCIYFFEKKKFTKKMIRKLSKVFIKK